MKHFEFFLLFMSKDCNKLAVDVPALIHARIFVSLFCVRAERWLIWSAEQAKLRLHFETVSTSGKQSYNSYRLYSVCQKRTFCASPYLRCLPTLSIMSVKCFNYLCNMITNAAEIYVELNPGLPWQSNIQQRKTLFTSRLDLNLRKKLVKCYIIWC